MEIKPSILIVEDDARVTGIIVDGLEKDYIIDSCKTCSEAYNKLANKNFQVACLDIGLPDGNGLEICRHIKTKHPDIKVIVLSKKSLIQDRLEVFKTGADDYLPKPFFVDELNARINNLLHRKGEASKSFEYNLDLSKGRFICKYGTIPLTKSETITLHAILNSSTKYATVERIIRNYSTYSIKLPSQDAVKVTISRINIKFKKYLGVSPLRNKYGFGYYLKF
ncbi:MAG TPA: response regulator [Candidatus Dojkabacteria bacterium]|nr:response regulator [Candidatus Dojkabacteria bacterium]